MGKITKKRKSEQTGKRNRSNKGKISVKTLVIIIGVLLLFFIALLFFVAQRQKSLPIAKNPTWKTYQEQVNEGTLEPSSKILEISLTYNVNANPQISIDSLKQKNGYVPNQSFSGTSYVLQYLDADNRITYQKTFQIPTSIHYDTADSTGKLRGGKINQAIVPLVLTLPWEDGIKSLRVLDQNKRTVIDKPFENVEIINNTSNFKSINGEDLLQMKKQKINFELFTPSAHAQSNDGKLDVVFIGNAYTDMNAFHSDVTKFSQTMLSLEPYKTRASQVTFAYVDSTTDLKCDFSTTIQRLLTCDEQTVISAVNNAGVKYDYIAVIYNTATYGGSGGQISVQYNGPDGPYMFVHELAHTFARLLDEYNYTGENSAGFIDNKVHNLDGTEGEGNCYAGTPPATSWSGLVSGSDYRVGCDNKTNWYASSQTSIMLSLGTDSHFFNSVSQCVINKRLDQVAGTFAGSNAVCYGGSAITPSADPVPSSVCLGSCPTLEPSVGVSIAQPSTGVSTAPSETISLEPSAGSSYDAIPSISIGGGGNGGGGGTGNGGIRNLISIILAFLFSLIMAFLRLFR